MKKILLFVIGMFPTVVLAAPMLCSDGSLPSNMPFVDSSKNMVPRVGSSKLLIRAGTKASDIPTAGQGDFRIECPASKMSNDDPIRFPRQPGKSHHHTFYGNVSIDAYSDLDKLADTGNSTCRGGIMNRSAYWTASIIDTKTGTPVIPEGSLWYYKSGNMVSTRTIVPMVKGLRMIAGNMYAKNEASATNIGFVCYVNGKAVNWVDGAAQPKKAGVDPKYIPACPKGAEVVAWVSFPQCWDGKNLDSADHISHMSYGYVYDKVTKQNYCPATHPIAMPKIRLNVHYRVKDDEGTKYWRASSDDYEGGNAGYSMHAAFVSGWHEESMRKITDNCIKPSLNCGAHMLGGNAADGYEVMDLPPREVR